MKTSSPATTAPYNGFDGQYIAGAWRPGRGAAALADRDPYTGEVLTQITLADRSDLDEAYASSAAAQRAWAASPPAERAGVLRRVVVILESRREEIITWLVREVGSTRLKAQLEWQTVHAQAVEAASLPYRVEGRILPIDIAGKESRVYRRPVGVIAVISPWNWPMTLSHRSVGPALALGNGVVLKPADDTPVTGGLLIARIYEEAGLPAGLFNVVVGAIEDIGDAMTLSDVPGLISFTGSTKVGRHIGCLATSAPMLKRVALELGGNSPLVVLDDADLDLAAAATVFGRFIHQGQICMSVNRVIAVDSIYDAFASKLAERVRGLKCGDPRLQDTAIGPVINRRQMDVLKKRIAAARAAGFRELAGGEPKELVLPPHLFADVPFDSDLAQSELFGPVLPLIRARDEDHAAQIANGTEYGLSSAVFTRDERRGLRFAERLKVGMTHINDMTVNAAANAPFGGEKNSGLGRFGGDANIHEFTTEHWVTVQHAARPYPF